MKTSFKISLLCILLLVILLILEAAGVTFSNQLLFSASQPSSVQYDDAVYIVDVIRQQSALSAHYTILIHQSGVPEYGYALTYPQSIIDQKKLLSDLLWEDQGITLIFPDDARLFIPKNNFTGGR
jgi:hypothetical protein